MHFQTGDGADERYAVYGFDGEGEEFVLGWADDPAALKRALELHPSWSFSRVDDRGAIDKPDKGEPDER